MCYSCNKKCYTFMYYHYHDRLIIIIYTENIQFVVVTFTLCNTKSDTITVVNKKPK